MGNRWEISQFLVLCLDLYFLCHVTSTMLSQYLGKIEIATFRVFSGYLELIGLVKVLS